MLPILSIVGRANSGKTTFLEELIAALRQDGHRVAVIKHAGEDFEIDTPGKDSWRFRQAGSELVAVSTSTKLAVIKKLEHDLSPEEFAREIDGDYDILLTEGFKQANTTKIEVHRKEQGKELVSNPQQLLAVITDEPLEVKVPQFGRDEISRIAALIESKIIAPHREEELELYVNESPVDLDESAKHILSKTVSGIITSLDGINGVKSVRMLMRRKS